MTATLVAPLLLRCKRRVPVAPSAPSLRSSHTASRIASLLLRCIPRVLEAPSVPSLCSSHGGIAHCFAFLALQAACACGAVGPFASLVTRRRRSLLRFSRVANGVCLWRRRSIRFAHFLTASRIASLLLRCKRRMPVAPSVPSLRSSHAASIIASLLLRCIPRVPVAPSVPRLELLDSAGTWDDSGLSLPPRADNAARTDAMP
jgi:hypothetical protein